MLKDYRSHPYQLQYQEKSFFTSLLGNEDGFWSSSGYANAVVAWPDIFNKAGGKSLIFSFPSFQRMALTSGSKAYCMIGSDRQWMATTVGELCLELPKWQFPFR
ncbi:hypothetical protein Mapa_001765 [Marchantia paleacea]|nr:hypothetical protein Mapa_001765 [Marchantia paleacea]